MAVLLSRVRFVRAFARYQRSLRFRRPMRQLKCTLNLKRGRPSKARRISRPLRVHENGKDALPELSLFKELETELATLGEALVKIHQSRVVEGQDEETILSTLIEEVQREQEAWYQQVQVMERLVNQAATAESGEEEVEELRENYEELRKKVELYNALLNEREREVDSLKQQLQDVNTASEMKQMKTGVSLKDLVATEGVALEGDLRLPTWPKEAAASFLSEKEQEVEIPPNEKETRIVPVKRRYKIDVNKMEVPGLAVVSVISLLGDGANGVWSLATARVPKKIKAIIEISMLCALLGSGATVAIIPFL